MSFPKEHNDKDHISQMSLWLTKLYDKGGGFINPESAYFHYFILFYSWSFDTFFFFLNTHDTDDAMWEMLISAERL